MTTWQTFAAGTITFKTSIAILMHCLILHFSLRDESCFVGSFTTKVVRSGAVWYIIKRTIMNIYYTGHLKDDFANKIEKSLIVNRYKILLSEYSMFPKNQSCIGIILSLKMCAGCQYFQEMPIFCHQQVFTRSMYLN